MYMRFVRLILAREKIAEFREFYDSRVIPALHVAPVDADLHVAAVAAFRDTVESSVSLVDRTSFVFTAPDALYFVGLKNKQIFLVEAKIGS